MPTIQENIQIDNIDAGIISALSADVRRSYADIAAEVGLSTAAVHDRVKKMVERGTIQRFSVQVDPDAVGLAFTAFVDFNLFQSGITGFCPPGFLLKKLGVPEGNGACSR